MHLLCNFSTTVAQICSNSEVCLFPVKAKTYVGHAHKIWYLEKKKENHKNQHSNWILYSSFLFCCCTEHEISFSCRENRKKNLQNFNNHLMTISCKRPNVPFLFSHLIISKTCIHFMKKAGQEAFRNSSCRLDCIPLRQFCKWWIIQAINCYATHLTVLMNCLYPWNYFKLI